MVTSDRSAPAASTSPPSSIASGLVIALAAMTVFGSGAGAEHGSEAARRAAEEIQAARDRADGAAQALFDAESDIDALTIEIADTEQQLAELEDTVAEMRTSLETQAVRRFVGNGSADLVLLQDINDINDGLASDLMVSIANENAYVDIDDFDATITEMDDLRIELSGQRTDAENARSGYEALLAAAEAEIEALAELEAQRLQDEQVEHELQALRRAEEEAAAERAAQRAATAQPPAEPAADSTAPSAPPNDSPEREPGPEPEPEPPPATGAGLVCPIAGPRAFADTWGAARSGGRSHEGVDMMSPGGTPLVAMEAGRVEFRTNTLGGNTVRLYGVSGTRYYYAHLSAWEGSNRPVSAGEVIGYVGKTGNTSANHLHLQIHPGGGMAVNPYPYVRTACG